MIEEDKSYTHLDLQVYSFERLSSSLSIDHILKGDYFSILLVNKGFLEVLINDCQYCLLTNELLTIPVRSSWEILKITNDVEISILSFTSAFLFKNTIKKPNIGFFEIFVAKFPSKVVLKSNQPILLTDLFALIENEKYKIRDYAFYDEIQLLSFNLLLYAVAALYIESSHDVKERYTRKEKLVFQFLEVLDINCKKQHSVKFYSDALYISEGHLSKVVKQVTNKTIKEFIKEAIILEAKILLRNGDLTILQIIEELHFSNSSCFSNFFKKSTSMSPSEYRLQLKL